jgi:ABC-type nitrate/sulfonate/bicarbonate transport system substrate-binding protein
MGYRRPVITRRLAGFLSALLLSASAAAQTPAPAPLRVITFDGGWNLPLWAAQRQGYFEAQGVAVQTRYTPSSDFLVSALLDGRADIALALIDNLVAVQEGQSEVKPAAPPDLFAFMGSDGGFLSVIAVPGITSVADLKGKTLSVDAMTTGAAFVLREILARNGVADADVIIVRAGGTANRYRELLAGKHQATLLRTPFDLQAQAQGMRQLARAESLGAYQGTAGIARRSWAREHADTLEGFMRAYRSAVDWLYDRANREVVEALLVANSRDMTPALARQSYDLLLADKGGISRDLTIDAAGLQAVLQLRSRYGVPKKVLDEPARYIDLSYHEHAFGKR